MTVATEFQHRLGNTVELLMRVTTVSLETIKIVKVLPGLEI